jgi:hypothetical protein
MARGRHRVTFFLSDEEEARFERWRKRGKDRNRGRVAKTILFAVIRDDEADDELAARAEEEKKPTKRSRKPSPGDDDRREERV